MSLGTQAPLRVIVLEIGSCYLRIGDASAPAGFTVTVRAPPLFGLLWYGGIVSAAAGAGGLSSLAAVLERVQEELTLTMCAVWTRALLARAGDCRVLVAEPLSTPTPARAAVLAALLGGAGVASVSFVRGAAAACAAAAASAESAGAPCALVVDVGAAGVRVVPVCCGSVLERCARESSVGASALIAIAVGIVLRAVRRLKGASVGATARASEWCRLPPLAEPLPAPASAMLGQGFAAYGSLITPSRSDLTDGALEGSLEKKIMTSTPSYASLLDPARGGLDGAVAFWVEGELERFSSVSSQPILTGREEATLTLSLPVAIADALGIPYVNEANPPRVAVPREVWASLANGSALFDGFVDGYDDVDECAGGDAADEDAVCARLFAQATAAAKHSHAALQRSEPLTDAIAATLLSSPIDFRAKLASSIVLVGGVACSQGFFSRLRVALERKVRSTPSMAGLGPLLPILRCTRGPLTRSPSATVWEGAAALALAFSGTRPDSLAPISLTASAVRQAASLGENENLTINSCIEVLSATTPARATTTAATSGVTAPSAPPAVVSRKRPPTISLSLPPAPPSVRNAEVAASSLPSSAAAARLAALGAGLARARGVKRG